MRASLIFVLAVLAGCGGDDGGGGGDLDAGGTRDSGPGIDTGPRPEEDAGPRDDAGPTPDAGPMDDAGPEPDAGPPGMGCGGKPLPGMPARTCPPGQFCDYTLEDICGAADAPGTCEPIPTVCTDELNPVCGCDGRDYSNPCEANAAGTAVASMGRCATTGDGANCDHSTAACESLPGPCPAGQWREVRGLCWGDCVPIEECYCDSPEDCPEMDGRDEWTCHMFRNRCGPYL